MPMTDQAAMALTAVFKEIQFGPGIRQFSVSNDGDPTVPSNFIIEWSQDGTTVDGRLFDGEVDLVAPMPGQVYSSIWIRGSAGGESYRVMGPSA